MKQIIFIWLKYLISYNYVGKLLRKLKNMYINVQWTRWNDVQVNQSFTYYFYVIVLIDCEGTREKVSSLFLSSENNEHK